MLSHNISQRQLSLGSFASVMGPVMSPSYLLAGNAVELESVRSNGINTDIGWVCTFPEQKELQFSLGLGLL